MLFLHVPLQSDGKFPIIQTEIIPESSYAGGSDMNTIFIGIAGGTGSGKTTLTEHLVSRFGDDIAVVHHDNYYKRQNCSFEERCRQNYDHPDAFDTELMIEDLKALNGQPAQPAQQHPQLRAAEFVCARIAVKCMDLKPDGAMQQVPHLFQCYRKCLKEKKLETAMDCMEEIAALSLLVTLRECRQLGTTLTPAQGSQYLQSHILPHQNRMAIRNRTEEISAQLQTALAKSGAPGVRGEAEKREIASAWLELALSCAKVSVKNDADELKAMEKQKQALGMEMG